MKRVAILDDYQGIGKSITDWASVKDEIEITIFEDHLADEDKVAARLAGFEIICAMRERTPFTASLLAKLPDLNLLVTSGMRNRGIDIQAANDQGVVVCGTPSVGRPTAELAWGLILGLARHIPEEDRRVRAGGWQRTVGVGLDGKTLGIAGLGNLGGRMAEIAKVFGMDIIAWSQNLTQERCDELGVELVTREELMSRSDFITVHLILSDRTRGVIGADELARMKPTAFIVNTARGPIIDEEALARVLKDGKIAGAGLDVYGTEPLPADHPFRSLENVIASPHLGYVEQSNYDAYFSGYEAAIRGYLDGEPVKVLEP